MEYAVKAETKEGNTLTLRRGFVSREAAEDHPVMMKLWRRVWIEEVPETLPRPTAAVAPRPWTSEPVYARGGTITFLYLKDATGRRIATVLGKAGEKEMTAEHILEAVNGTTPTDR